MGSQHSWVGGDPTDHRTVGSLNSLGLKGTSKPAESQDALTLLCHHPPSATGRAPSTHQPVAS